MLFTKTTPDCSKLVRDFELDYPNAKEEEDPGFPLAFGPVMETTILVDSDHGYDQKLNRSLTGWISIFSSTPVVCQNKRQRLVSSSTYAAAFSTLRTATDEVMSIRYILRCL